jgi:hypothetical protein
MGVGSNEMSINCYKRTEKGRSYTVLNCRSRVEHDRGWSSFGSSVAFSAATSIATIGNFLQSTQSDSRLTFSDITTYLI